MLSVTLNDINSRNVVRAISYTTLLKTMKKKVTAEKQDIGKLGKLCFERKACGRKLLATF